MQSPFPGMDPFLEPHWLDVHSVLATSSRESLNQQLPDDLIACVEERMAIERGVCAEPTIERCVNVIEARTGRLITGIHLKSPTPIRIHALLASGVNVVEIDLIRTADALDSSYRAVIRI